MRSALTVLLLVVGVVLAPVCASDTLPVRELRAGMHLIRAEVAGTFASRMQGLMHRTALAPNTGMLFLFDQPEAQCMWMKNTLIPLSVAFLDDDGTVVNIARMEPQTEQSHCSARPVRVALEMQQGWFAARGIGPGSRIEGIPPLPR